jgi:hypothetical protein
MSENRKTSGGTDVAHQAHWIRCIQQPLTSHAYDVQLIPAGVLDATNNREVRTGKILGFLAGHRDLVFSHILGVLGQTDELKAAATVEARKPGQ